MARAAAGIIKIVNGDNVTIINVKLEELWIPLL